ncbi:hypothetical protein HOK15_03365 [Candidatus Falkowbacteria bacterium]|nr:hypothetical protein [Candidatus Falkowbacteria bacterium]
MWFLIVFLLSISPRLIMFILFVATDYLGSAFDSVFWPIVGFLFMPWTTLWCAYVWNNGEFGTWRIIVLVLCVLADLGGGKTVTSGSSS